jgi:hypothetical protein
MSKVLRAYVRSVLAEAALPDPGLDVAFKGLAARAKEQGGLSDVPVDVGGRSFRVSVVLDVDGRYGKQGNHFGLVDGQNFGGGKTPAAALGAAKRRIAFLLGPQQERHRAGGAELEAAMADAELRRRERNRF